MPTFTGRKNLSLLARAIGVPRTTVDASLEQVGLTGRDKERFKGYSLGMKQRLAIAATLLKSPDLLILDEPTNGLDPAGIRDIRDMIRGLGESGVTVLLSSHILAEVQQVCHSVSIIGNGRLLASGDVDDLVGEGSTSTTRVRVADQPTAANHLKRAGYTVASNGDGALHVEGAAQHRADHPAARRAGHVRQRAHPGPSRPGVGVSAADQGRDVEGRCRMRLFLVELSRFRSRRAIALMLIAAALLTAVLATATIWETRPVSAQDMANAQAQAEAEAQQPWFQRDMKRCQEHPRRFMGPGATAEDCEQMMPQADWFIDRSELSLRQVQSDTGIAVLMIVSALMIIIGATFAGADWSSGSMSNQVLFEPRRAKVWLAKAAALFAGTLIAAAVIVAAFWVTIYVTAELRGISTGATVQENIRWVAGRGVLLAALGALGGYALSMLLRHTVGTLAVMFAYAVGGEALTASLPISGAGRWSLSNNVFAWLYDGHRYYDDSLPCSPREMCDQMARMTQGQGVSYLGLLLVVVVLLSVLFFRRRDIP